MTEKMEPVSTMKGMDMRFGITCPRTVTRSSRALVSKQDLGNSCRCILGDSVRRVKRVVEVHQMDRSGFWSTPLSPLCTSNSNDVWYVACPSSNTMKVYRR